MRESTNERSTSSGPLDALVASQPIGSNHSSPPRPAATAVGRRRSGWIRRFFWLDERIAKVKNAGLAANESGWPEFEAARAAREALTRLSELRPSNLAVLTLRRNEALGLIHATMRRRGIAYSTEHLTQQDWTNAASIAEISELVSRLTNAQRTSLEAALAEGGQSYLLQLNAAGRRRAARILGRTAQHLGGLYSSDREQLERLRVLRWLRIGPFLFALVVLLGLGARWLDHHQHRENLAFHRRVTATSALDASYLDTSRLVDGDRTNLGFHTTSEDAHPSVTIDLGSSKRFSKVVIYNRADCCKERGIPMILEVSRDGVDFERLAERQVAFDVWTVKGLQAVGRYVRIRPDGSGLFHLAEVEIFE